MLHIQTDSQILEAGRLDDTLGIVVANREEIVAVLGLTGYGDIVALVYSGTHQVVLPVNRLVTIIEVVVADDIQAASGGVAYIRVVRLDNRTVH